MSFGPLVYNVFTEIECKHQTSDPISSDSNTYYGQHLTMGASWSMIEHSSRHLKPGSNNSSIT